jgi:DNA-binding NtrC family response regulator
VDCESVSADEWRRHWGDESGGARLEARAGGGTVYLDRVTALDAERQELLLSAISAWPRTSLGSSEGEAAPPRLLAGSRVDPAVVVKEGHLLDALRRRLAESTVVLPALRERKEDIALLARHFVQAICEINQLPSISISAEALASLERYAWPSNARELRNAVEHAVILAAEGTIRPQDLPDKIREEQAGEAAPARYAANDRFRDAKRAVVDSFERAYLSDLLERHGGNVTSASRHAGMLRSALQRLLRKHGLRSADFRRPRAAPQRRRAAETGLD